MKAAHSIDILCRVLKEAITLHFKASRKTNRNRSIRQCWIEDGIRVSLKLTLRLKKEMAGGRALEAFLMRR